MNLCTRVIKRARSTGTGRALTLLAAVSGAVAIAVPTAHARVDPGGGIGSAVLRDCRIDVRSSSVAIGLAKHLFVIYSDGSESYYRGGPSKGGGSSASSGSSSGSSGSGSSSGSSGSSGSGPGAFGYITTDHGAYVPGTVDYDTGAPSKTVMTGSGACGKDSCFVSQLDRIENRRVTYEALGPNSNSVARTLLDKCGVPANKPGGWAPGWGTVL